MSTAASGADDPALQRALDALAPPGLLIAHRIISAGDENALLDAEMASIGATALKVRRASGAARIVARQLLAQFGHAAAAVPRGPSGAPVWPAGIVGSLGHDDRIAAAAIGRQRDFGSVGIDIEPAVPLPADMLTLVATPAEIERMSSDPLRARLLFAAKEAVYKAAWPLDGVFLEFHDVTVDPAANVAVTKNGRTFSLRDHVSSHVVVLAIPQA